MGLYGWLIGRWEMDAVVVALPRWRAKRAASAATL